MFKPVVYSYSGSGTIKVFDSKKSKTVLVCSIIVPQITKKLIITWIGFGTVFEIKNGRERIVAPWINSGPLRSEVRYVER